MPKQTKSQCPVLSSKSPGLLIITVSDVHNLFDAADDRLAIGKIDVTNELR
jgi:hypothetical protein